MVSKATGQASAGRLAIDHGVVSEEEAGRLDAVLSLSSSADPPEGPPGGAYCISFHNAWDAELSTGCFDLSFESLEDEAVNGAAGFAYALPLPAGTTRIKLRHGSEDLDERAASPNAPQISLQSPGGGEAWDGIQTVSWTSDDLDGDDLTFTVLYSHDGGESWKPVAIDLSDYSHRLDTTSLPGSDHARVRVLVRDGFHTASADSGSFSVPTKAPDVQISTPSEGVALLSQQATVLDGSAYDPEQGYLSGKALSWWSDRDGLLGRGDTVVLPGLTLSPGQHVLTLTATDEDQQMGEARIRVFVGLRSYLPAILRGGG